MVEGEALDGPERRGRRGVPFGDRLLLGDPGVGECHRGLEVLLGDLLEHRLDPAERQRPPRLHPCRPLEPAASDSGAVARAEVLDLDRAVAHP